MKIILNTISILIIIKLEGNVNVFKKIINFPCHFIKLMILLNLIIIKARIAQLVEQWIEDPRVTSSNLVLGILTFEK